MAPARALLVTTYLGTLRLYGHELGRREIRVCRSSLSEYLAAAGQEHRGLVDRGDRALMERSRGVRARVDVPARVQNSVNNRSYKKSRGHVPLNPSINRRSSTFQHDRAVREADSGRHIVEHDVVEDYRPIERAVARGGTTEEDGRVGDRGVDDRFGRDAL